MVHIPTHIRTDDVRVADIAKFNELLESLSVCIKPAAEADSQGSGGGEASHGGGPMDVDAAIEELMADATFDGVWTQMSAPPSSSCWHHCF